MAAPADTEMIPKTDAEVANQLRRDFPRWDFFPLRRLVERLGDTAQVRQLYRACKEVSEDDYLVAVLMRPDRNIHTCVIPGRASYERTVKVLQQVENDWPIGGSNVARDD